MQETQMAFADRHFVVVDPQKESAEDVYFGHCVALRPKAPPIPKAVTFVEKYHQGSLHFHGAQGSQLMGINYLCNYAIRMETTRMD